MTALAVPARQVGSAAGDWLASVSSRAIQQAAIGSRQQSDRLPKSIRLAGSWETVFVCHWLCQCLPLGWLPTRPTEKTLAEPVAHTSLAGGRARLRSKSTSEVSAHRAPQVVRGTGSPLQQVAEQRLRCTVPIAKTHLSERRSVSVHRIGEAFPEATKPVDYQAQSPMVTRPTPHRPHTSASSSRGRCHVGGLRSTQASSC
jgi:hypothetical protein